MRLNMQGNLAVLLCCLHILPLSLIDGYIVDSENGNDNNNGETINDPFKTITRCIDALANPGDECKIRSGYYHEVVTVTGIQGSTDLPVKIVGYEDERPIWDGTVAIQPGQWTFDQDTEICSAKIDQDIFALFYESNLMTAARWPNSKWSDKSFFDHQNWRPCPDSERGTIVDDALAEANLNFTGSMAILNIGSWETWVRQVLEHEPGTNFFTYNDDFGNIKFKNQQYYLESSLELLDAPEEWFYDKDTQILHLIMPESSEKTCPNTEESENVLRGRTVDNVLEIADSSNVIVANITFWASNVIASNSVEAIQLDSLIFSFPSSSHRMLKSEAFPKETTLVGDNHVVVNCTFEGAEGPALNYDGGSMLVHNSEFSYNDWVGQGNLGTVFAKDRRSPGEFSQNTMYYNGVAHGLRAVGNSMYTNVTMNYWEGQCWGEIESDGASVHIQVGAQTNIPISYSNWIHTSPKKGIRFDGSGEPVCHQKSGCGGYVGFNVVWNSEDKEIYTKGDNHTVVNNVGWDDLDTDGCTICVPPEHQGVVMNEDSIVVNNGASMFQGGGGIIENNYESTNVKKQMKDTDNYDFRPVNDGGFITPDGGEIIGAYTSGDSSQFYWIPGRKLYKTSFPIPQNGAEVSAERTDVICQTGSHLRNQ